MGQILFLPQRIFISKKIGVRYDNIAGRNSHFHRTAGPVKIYAQIYLQAPAE